MASLKLPLKPLLCTANRLISQYPRHYFFKNPSAALLVSQARSASFLTSLSDNRGAYSKRIRRGRGPASGKGKTSGRGHKGQKQHGKVPAGFQGGQTPLEKVKGHRGFINHFSVDMTLVNLDRIQHWVDQGRLDTTKAITIKELQESRCLHGIKDGVKLLARNGSSLKHPIHITVSRASESAIAAVESAGGTVQTRYYTRSSIQRILQGKTHPTLSLLSAPLSSLQTTSDTTKIPPLASEIADAESRMQETPTGMADLNKPQHGIDQTYPPPERFQYRLPDAYSRRDLEYYRDPAHRGYLSYQIEDGAGPSLFFKTPSQIEGAMENAKQKTRKTKVGAGTASQNRLF